MNDAYCALFEIDVINTKSQGFTDTAAQVEENSNKEFVTEIFRRVFQLLYFIGLQICLHQLTVNALSVRFYTNSVLMVCRDTIIRGREKAITGRAPTPFVNITFSPPYQKNGVSEDVHPRPPRYAVRVL